MQRVTIGIPVHAEPKQLRATLASLEAYTVQPVKFLILADDSAASLQKELARYPHLSVSACATPQEAAAGFNRLATADDAEVLVLLESGVIVGPGWLDICWRRFPQIRKTGWLGHQPTAPGTNRVSFPKPEVRPRR